MPSVLFVCTANRFRSPVAAAIFMKALYEEENQKTTSWNFGNVKDWNTGSAGLSAPDGETVLPEVLEAANQLGINLYDHRSVQLNSALLSEHDLILVMEESHKDVLKKEFPHLHERIYLLSYVVEFASYDIPDTHDSIQEVIGVVAKINELIRRNLRYICVLAIALHNRRNKPQ